MAIPWYGSYKRRCVRPSRARGSDGRLRGLRWPPCLPTAARAEHADSYVQQVNVYPLGDAATLKSTRFVDGFPKPFHSPPVSDASWFSEQVATVNEEPVRERDRVMMGMLTSIGIERGKKFAPDAKTQSALDAAILDGGA